MKLGGVNGAAIVPIGAAALGMVALLWFSNHTNGQRIRSLETRLAEREADIAVERREGAAQRIASAGQLSSARTTSTSDHTAPPSAAERVAFIESVYAEQTIDAAWAPSEKRGIEAVLRKQLKESRLESLDCRQTLCRAELRHRNAERYSEFIDRFLVDYRDLGVGQAEWYRTDVDAEGAVKNTIYLAKRGAEIPRRKHSPHP